MSKVSVDFVAHLAQAFNKPTHFVEAALKLHNITSLPKFRTPDDGLADFYSLMTSHYDESPSRTKQEFTAECDINVIMKRFIASDFDPTSLPLTSRKGMYGDFTNMPDSYHAALNYVRDTEASFLGLPADLRARFDNDPQVFLDFVSDAANVPELIKLGLATLVDIPAPSASHVAGDGGGVSTPPVGDSSASKPSKKASRDDGSKGGD